MENELEMKAIALLAEKFREDNPKMNILFDGLADNKDLVFTVLDMPNRNWEFTERKHVISYDEYLHACGEII